MFCCRAFYPRCVTMRLSCDRLLLATPTFHYPHRLTPRLPSSHAVIIIATLVPQSLSFTMSRTSLSSSGSYALQAGGTWTCTECSYVNATRENECGNCPAPRPDPYAFCTSVRNTRLTKATPAAPSSSASAAPLARRSLRSSGSAVAPQPTATDRRAGKRKASSNGATTVHPVKRAKEEEADDDEGSAVEDVDECESDSEDESLQQRYVNRPKRHCVEQTQQRLNTYYNATKPTATATTTTPQLKHVQQPPPAPPARNRLPQHDKPPTKPAKPNPTQPIPPAAVAVTVPAAFVPPPLAATPFVPSTREDTLTLLHRVHAALALSAYPTATSALLPSRTAHLAHVSTFLSRHLSTRSPAALYIAGRPGVGKTLTVDWALQGVFGCGVAVLGSKDGVAGGGGGSGKVWRYGGGKSRGGKGGVGGAGLPVTTVVTVNAIALMKGHGNFWCKLLALLTTHKPNTTHHNELPADQAQQRIHTLVANTRKRGEMIVLAVDEIDALLSSASSTAAGGGGGSLAGGGGGGSFGLLSALFRLVYGAESCVVLVSISNNITLLDAHCSTLAAANSLPERVMFSTYSQDDLLCILQERLLRCLPASSTASSSSSAASPAAVSASPVALPFFAPAALEFICKATSKDTGDIRRCLRDCRHAIQQLITSTPTTTTTTPPTAYTPATYHLTVSSLARVKAEREAATQHGRLTDLSPQQLHVLWVAALVGGLALGVGGGGGGGCGSEVYRRCCVRVRGCGLTELSGGEVGAVLEMLESEGMVRKEKQGKVVRYVSVVSVERMRRQLRGDIWDVLWSKAELIQSKA